jgi:hypothetical protein
MIPTGVIKSPKKIPETTPRRKPRRTCVARLIRFFRAIATLDYSPGCILTNSKTKPWPTTKPVDQG